MHKNENIKYGRFNPNSAEFLGGFQRGEWEDEYSPTFVSEEIYRNKDGSLFIHIKWGVDTERGFQFENERYPTHSNSIISPDEVLDWIKKNIFWIKTQDISRLLSAIREN